ncbi:hypothetical protein EMIHUDRAFT_195194 [Emiliania huxleyi CCMP1516]|uniref:Uncharacterized protein n=2 Tax=Emiliania huxleyi TaxID=2903 RepID=A0A0D3JH30_EMIH1|nr:hypothetical protein EMIHUDRAFT_195194 [Emiliania huxleyi CCMP1516]EOD22815.1 hypothetical protein EMIHUDRAFT_195194 [Emiliania huxleyi CCMP1516]|eukprot:XP_005775244.1 hypothetical protein EMIHUDRAFT_195194 [Emiliania huxleyi CCMP1516]
MAYFTDNSADQLIAGSLRSGDVVLINRPCRSLHPPAAALCWLSKHGLSGDGRGWDHAALVVVNEKSEERLMQGGDIAEATLLPLRGERDTTALQAPPRKQRAGALGWGRGRRWQAGTRAMLTDEFRMQKSPDGFDADASLTRCGALMLETTGSLDLPSDAASGPAGCPSARCANLWEVYRRMRAGDRRHATLTPADLKRLPLFERPITLRS